MPQKILKALIPTVAAMAATIVAALPASAHEGRHETLTPAEAVRHLLSQPDHIVALAGFAVLATAGGWTWRRRTARK